MPRPSTVWTSWPSAWTASIVQLLTGVPSNSTVQAPQLVVSQPVWVPVSCEPLAEQVRQQQPRLDVEGARPAVDGDRHPAYRYVVGRAGSVISSKRLVIVRRPWSLVGGDPGQDPGHEGVDDVALVVGTAAVVGPRLGGRGREVGGPARCASASRACPASESAASRASMVRPPTPLSAMPARTTRSPSSSTATAAPAVAKSPTRRSSLRKPPASRALRRRDDRLDRDLVVGQGVLERTGDEVADRDGAAAARALGDDLAAERGDHRGPVALRVGVAQRADQGAAGADDRVGDQGRGGGHRRLPLGEERGALEVGVPAQRADVQGAVGVDPVVGEVGQVVDVDEQLGRGEAELQQRHQALAAGQHLGLAVALVEQRDRLVEAARGLVAEPGRDTLRTPRGRPGVGRTARSGVGWRGSGPTAGRASATGASRWPSGRGAAPGAAATGPARAGRPP